MDQQHDPGVSHNNFSGGVCGTALAFAVTTPEPSGVMEPACGTADPAGRVRSPRPIGPPAGFVRDRVTKQSSGGIHPNGRDAEGAGAWSFVARKAGRGDPLAARFGRTMGHLTWAVPDQPHVGCAPPGDDATDNGADNMQLGVIGLSRMGANISRRLMRAGHSTVVAGMTPIPRCRDWARTARPPQPA